MKPKVHFANKHSFKTFFHSALMTATLLFLALGSAKFLPSASSRAKQNIQNSGRPQSIPRKSCLACSERADRFIYAPLLDLPEAQGSELVFNSRSTQEMDITPTFYKLDGTAIVGKPVRVKPSEIRYVDLKKLIPRQYRNDRDWGGMTLAYTGGTREMWAQLRLLRVNGGGSVDEFFTVPQESRADMQEAVWWAPPQSQAIIALGNITNTATSATVLFGDGKAQIVNLAPHATEVIRYTPNSLEGGQSVAINITGAAGSIVPTGVIASTDGSFNSVIRFYNTKTGKQPHLFANGLRLAGVIPHMILKNTSSAPITATPEFIPSGGRSVGNPLTLPAITLSPRQTVEVDLGPLMSAAKIRNDLNMVSAKVSNSGAPGSLIGAIYSNDYATGVNYDVPLRDSGPLRNATGSYPWRLDSDYSTVVSITNIGSQPADFITKIRYEGGEYLPQLRTLAVGETAVFDLKKIRDEQIPDKDGNPLLHKAAVGQFHWSVLRGGDNVRLIGRAEMVSASKKVSSSYSCPVCCPDSGPYGYYNPQLLTLVVDGFQSTTGVGDYIDCNGRPSYIGGPLWLHDWEVENPAVISYANENGDTNTIYGLSGGFSRFWAYYTFMSYDNDGMDCYPRPDTAICEGEATVVSVTLTATGTQEVGKSDHYISLINTGNVTITATLNPSGTDPSVIQWTGGSAGADNLHRVVSTSSASDTVIAARVVGETDEADTVKIHVVDATTPPPAADATKTFSNGGTTSPLDVFDFGLTSFYNPSRGVNYPTYNVDAYFSSDRWVFRVRDIMHSYKTGVDSHGRFDLPVGNPPVFPIVPGLTLEQSHNIARSDLDTTGLPPGTGPNFTHYWVQFLVEAHEQYHVTDFYSQLYWFNSMGLFEIQDVEATTVNVIFDCLDTTTTTKSAAITKETPTWNTAIGNRHIQAFNAYNTGAEVRAYAAINPQYVPIRNAIPNP